MNVYKLQFLSCRLVTVIHKVLSVPKAHPQYILSGQVRTVPIRIMAQRSITSFFKVNPAKKAAVADKEKEQKEKPIGNKNHVENSIVHSAEKKSSKRLRLESSGSDSEVSPTLKDATLKRKKLKRQRIESSGSESEVSKSNERQSPLPELSVVKEKPASPNKTEKALQKGDGILKLEETKKSPKNKKKTSKSLSETSKQTSPITDNLEKADSANEDSPKNSPNKKVSLKKSPSINAHSETNQVGAIDQNREVSENDKQNGKIKVEGNNAVATKDQVPESLYDPSKAKYDPVADACWRAAEPVPYLALARTLDLIEGTSGRLKIVEILANYFRSVIALTPDDLLPSMYLCLNQLAPAYCGLELGIAETYLMKAVGQCTGRSLAQVRAAATRAGDLGAAAAAARATQRTMFAAPPLTVRKVFAALHDIARMTGPASVAKKINRIQTLFVASKQCEAKFLIRSLEGKLRVGLAEQSALQALAQAAARTPPGGDVLDAARGLDPEEFKARVDADALALKTTYCECPDYGRVVPALLAHGARALPLHCRLAPGTPLKPMLAHPTRGVADIFARFEGAEFTCEWKYDGERAQIHVPERDGAPDLRAAALFSRNQEDNTGKYPDVVGRLAALLGPDVRSCVLDCEVVAYDPRAAEILPFQVLSTRKRKAVAEGDVAVQVCVFAFDLLYLNGEPLVRRELRERRALLQRHFRAVEGQWQFARARDCSSAEDVQQFLEEAVRGSCEGLMVKTLVGASARYDIARRSHNWLKLKKDYLEGAGDSVDVVVIGAYHGRGRRGGAYGGFLAAARDPAGDGYQSLCKLGTGFTDEDLRALADQLAPHVIERPRAYYSYDGSHEPDVWFAPALVWEVRCADLSLSPAHRAAAGLLDPERGISLRFPRFVRARPDKTPEQATTAQQLVDMYLAQDQIRNQTAKPRADLDDFY